MALPDLIAVEDMLRPAERSGASISPDGVRIAFLAPWKNRWGVWVQDLDGSAEPRCVTIDETRTVLRFEWADGGDENWHVHRVDLDHAEAHAVDLFAGTTTDTGDIELSRRDRRTGELHRVATCTGADHLVGEAQSDDMVDALRARGVEVEYLVFPDEGHMFVNPENLHAMFRAAERFLARHLGGRDERA